MGKTVYPYLGPGKTLDDVELARAALQKAYEDRGFKTVFVDVPQQNVVAGRVRLAVTETPIGQVAVDNAKHMSARRVTASLPALRVGEVPDLNQFGTQLRAFNGRSLDRQVTPELKAGAAPGTVDVLLHVEDKLALHGSLEVSNRYSRDTTPTRVQANLRYENLWGLGHSISAFYAVAPERRDDSQVYVLAYGMPLSDTLRYEVTGLVSDSDVATVGSTNVLGKGASATVALTKTLAGPGGLYHYFGASVAYKDFTDIVRFGATTDRAPITYFPATLSYGGSYAWGKNLVSFNAALHLAFRGLGSDSAAFEYKRANATGGFAYWRAGLSWQRDLPGNAQLYVSLDEQLSSGPLISSEQFAAGGAGSVRGYLQSEAIGDNAVASTLEFRAPSLAPLIGGFFDELRFLGFIDAARLRVIDPLADQTPRFDLIGVGAGLRMRMFGRISGDLDVAWPLLDAGGTRSGDPRLHFRIGADF